MTEARVAADGDGPGWAGQASVFDLFRAAARRAPGDPALSDGVRTFSYAQTLDRALRLAGALRARGLRRGDRVALLSENRIEFAETQLACACLGLVVACQNWRLATEELAHCVALASPGLVIASARHLGAFAATGLDLPALEIETAWPDLLAHPPLEGPLPAVDPEEGLVILYTSGTTGMPKGALISHRAEIARMCVYRMDLGAGREDGFCAWAPMFHMGSTDATLGTLMTGGCVHVVDGFDAKRIVEVMAGHRLGWHLLMPGSIEPIVDVLKTTNAQVQGIRAIGAMIDLVPRAVAAELSRLSGAPYLNSFGSTETGLPPCSGRLMGPEALLSEPLSKRPSSMVDIRLVDPDGAEVPDGEPGEMSVKGPTVFSGYWNAPEVNARDFRGGRFRMGDMFVRNADGSYDFVDRAKYMIKSGGENIYPAEVERVLLADARVRDAVVVRKADPKWGEVPVALIARGDDSLDEAAVEALCRAALAGYKRPREVRFVDYDWLPRSTTGKILRHEIERSLKDL